nr:type II toxin-antitoxin system YhaV family toxin [Thioalkalivibrio sp.]
MFYRYHGANQSDPLAWVNDEDTKRAYESSDDAYRVFRRMLGKGHPPDDWDPLLSEAQKALQRMQESRARAAATQR